MLLFDQINITLIVIACVNFLLAVAIFLNDRKQKINIVYSLITLSIIGWVVAMIFYRSAPQETSLFWGKVLYVSATLIASTFLYFTYIFPSQKGKYIPLKSAAIFLANIVIVAMVVLPDFIILRVNVRPGQEKEIFFSSYYWFYFLYIFLLFTLGFWRLFRKYKKSIGIERQQALYVFIGYSITGNLAFVTNLVMPWVGSPFLNWIGQIFTIIIVTFTTYAIIKHQLFNLKVVATEILTLLLVITTLIQVLTSPSEGEAIFRIIIFLAILGFSISLIKSEIKEIKQREQLEVLSKRLASANEQLKVLDKARADFITIASHQLRTPPATIKWYLAALLSGDYGQLSDDVKNQLIRTEVTNNSLISLIDDLLNVSRIERGKLEFIFAPTDLVAITQLTVDQLVPQAQIKNLKLVFQKPTVEILPITADKEKLRQVINNLIDNAIKYTKAGQVTVDISKTAKDIVLKVMDTGKGITKNQLKEIFGKYERGQQRAQNSTGLGLGLYVAKVIVEQHGGRIWVESKGEGKGSSFIFNIPIKSKIKNTVFDLVKDQNTEPAGR